MMKKLKIENLGRLFLRPVTMLVEWAKRRMSPPLRIKMTRQSLMISLPASQGGRLHILPRPGGSSGLTRTFEVVAAGEGKFTLQASPDNLALATYASQREAALALATLNKALTGSIVWKWAFRLVLAWLAWLFITSYMEVSQQNANAVKPDVLGLGPAPQGTLPNIPAEPAAFQSIPSVTAPDGGDLSNYIFQKAKAAQLAQKDALPPKAGVDNAAGLEAFGLKGAAGGGSGEGCDPKLAFKVPQK